MLDSRQPGVAPGGPSVHRWRAATLGCGGPRYASSSGALHCFLIVQTGREREGGGTNSREASHG